MYAVSAKQKNTICVLLLLFVFLLLRTPKLQNEYVIKPVQSVHFCCSTPSISPDGRAWTPLGTGGPSFRSLSVSAQTHEIHEVSSCLIHSVVEPWKINLGHGGSMLFGTPF